MTEHEAKGFIQGKLDCMNKCDVFDCKGTDECDSCNYCYSQGNFGEQKKAFEMAINALEKQIPKKTVNYSRVDVPNDIVACCPICYGNVDWTYNGNWRRGNPKYCKNCGQKLDWGNE